MAGTNFANDFIATLRKHKGPCCLHMKHVYLLGIKPLLTCTYQAFDAALVYIFRMSDHHEEDKF